MSGDTDTGYGGSPSVPYTHLGGASSDAESGYGTTYSPGDPGTGYGAGQVPTPAGGGGGGSTTTPADSTSVASLFPWAGQLGLSEDWLQNVLATSPGDGEILAKLRQTSQYKQRFPGLYRPDGSMRMNEAQYIDTENNFRQIFQQAGFGNRIDLSSPTSYVGIFDSEQDPNELKQRVDTYNGIETAGQSTKDAFYVYAGLNVSTDDLFAAAVDPAAAQNLQDTYNAAVAKNPFDYTTWINRATQVGLDRVSKTLTGLQSQGALTGSAVQEVLRTDPNFARQIMDALYTGGTGGTPTQELSLDELLHSFEYAALGAAATNAGLALPTKERIAEITSAGIDRARASQLYTQYGANKGVYDAAVQRATNQGFGQEQFEQGSFLGNAADAENLQVGLARETAAGSQQGVVGFSESKGRIAQGGLRRL